jgi:Rrf2 family nitric oxide-sensitive transcriptional repressor
VDIETLANAEDYLVDYGLLLEDVAVYQSLPYGSERGRLEWDEIQLTRPGHAAGAADNYITNPAFPRSEAVVAFQTRLLAGLRDYAASVGDDHWQARLWLATARGLLLLASRQLSSYAVEPHRRSRGPRYVNDAKLVQVAYAEALRLLRELTDHLRARQPAPLPDLPFPGEHRPNPASAAGLASALVTALDRGLGDTTDRVSVEGRPHLTDYVTRSGRALVARLHTQREAPVLYLAARPDRPASLQQISVAYGVSQHHLVKVAGRLIEKGFVTSVRGRNGGLRLSRPPEAINIGAVVRATEPHFNLVECFDEERNACPIDKVCGLKGVLRAAQTAFLRELDRHTLAEFLPRAPALISLWRVRGVRS